MIASVFEEGTRHREVRSPTRGHTARKQQNLKDKASTRAEAVGGQTRAGAPSSQGLSSLGQAGGQRGGHTEPFAFPARKQLSKRTFQDVLEEQSEDKDREAKRPKTEEGEALGAGRERD